MPTEDFSKELLAWYDRVKRPMPWRENITPYRVWVSEIMLQQTRIEAAKGYFLRFTEALPDVFALAAADEETVLKLWEGLGYYSRARNLHKCARILVSDYGGEFPRTAAELMKLPGIGEYTAGAIASIACGECAPAVDGNVLRVLSRMEKCAVSIANPAVKRDFRDKLRAIYPADRPGDFTAALMELGETVCTPGTPDCALCPLADFCAAHRAGEETRYPVMPEKKPRRIEHRRVHLLICGDKIAVRQRPETGLLARLWEFPNDEETDVPGSADFCGECVHIFSHVEWHMRGYISCLSEEAPGYVWVTAEERAALAMPAAFRYYDKIAKELSL